MSRNRLLILGAAIVVVIVAVGVVVALGQGHGGANRTYSLNVSGTAMSPSTITAKQGDHLTISVTADRKEEIHLHGYDIHFEVPAAGQTVTHSFTADKSGSFEIEIEETSTKVGDLVVNP